ncbi:hypothetical protein [Kitasatospora cinereorecta]|uniref:Uncharacterized protein n=1 Tax=Kitasatospora cinereorecta TaxID=285560 RepID=A0ABW0V535_9ACTN
MGLEDDLTRLLEGSVEELMPPVRAMVAEGVRLGKRRRRVRRAVQAAGSTLVACGVVAAGVLLVPRFGGSADVQAADGAPSSVVSASASGASGAPAGSSPSLSPLPSPSPTGPMVDMTWQGMLKIFADQLPPGARLTNLDPFAVNYNNRGGEHYIEVQYDDGFGLSTVMVEFSHGSPGTAGTMSCEGWPGGSDEGPRKPGNEKPMCRTTTLPDGSLMMSYITGTDVVGLYDQVVKLRRADGDYVSVTAANATLDQESGKGGIPITVTRDRPPLGLSAWEAVVRSPQWQARIPERTAVEAVAYAKSVKRFPCPQGTKPADCVID